MGYLQTVLKCLMIATSKPIGGDMTIAAIQARIDKLEAAITTQDYTLNHILLLAGEWVGLKKSIGQTEEGAWAMLWRTRKI